MTHEHRLEDVPPDAMADATLLADILHLLHPPHDPADGMHALPVKATVRELRRLIGTPAHTANTVASWLEQFDIVNNPTTAELAQAVHVDVPALIRAHFPDDTEHATDIALGELFNAGAVIVIVVQQDGVTRIASSPRMSPADVRTNLGILGRTLDDSPAASNRRAAQHDGSARGAFGEPAVTHSNPHNADGDRNTTSTDPDTTEPAVTPPPADPGRPATAAWPTTDPADDVCDLDGLSRIEHGNDYNPDAHGPWSPTDDLDALAGTEPTG